MIKVFKTDLFRLFRSKSFYAFPIFLIVFLTIELMFSGIVKETGTEVAEDGTETVFETSSDADGAGVSIEVRVDAGQEESTENAYTEYGIKDLLGAVTDGMILMFLGITLVIFATNETKNGFIKTAAVCVSDKAYMPLSKIAVSLVITVIYVIEFAVLRFIFTFLSSAITGRPLKYVSLPEGDAGRFAAYILLCVLVHVAFSALLMLLHELFRSRAIGIVWIFVEAAGLFGEIIILLFVFLREGLHVFEGFEISKYLLMNNIMNGYTSAAYNPATVLVMSLIYLICGGGAAMWLAKHKDVR